MQTPKRLSNDQMEFFDIFGFLYFPGLLSDRIDRIVEEFETIWLNNGGGHDGNEHDGTQRSAILPFLDRSEYLSSLLDDSRVHDIVSSLCGEDFNYLGGDGNLYTRDTLWHSDGYGNKSVLTIKMAFYLDPITADSGALRVIPGSHRVGEPFADAMEEGIADANAQREELLKGKGIRIRRDKALMSLVWRLFGVPPNQVPSQTLSTIPGDVIVFNHNIKHASFGGNKRRRMFTMNFTGKYLKKNLPELREYLGGHARFWIERMHGEAMIRTAGPERMVHLQQIRENDTHLADLTRELRKTMKEPARG